MGCRCNRGLIEKRTICFVLFFRGRSVKVPRREEPGPGTGAEASGVHVRPGMQRGWNVRPGVCFTPHLPFSVLLAYSDKHSCHKRYVCICMCLSGPVSHFDRLLLVRHLRRQASEWLLCAQQEACVFRYFDWAGRSSSASV